MFILFDQFLPPELALDDANLSDYFRRYYSLKASDTIEVRKIRQSIDARSRQVKVALKAEVYVNEPAPSLLTQHITYGNVANKKPVIVVGCGPAGLFAALRLIELGYKPIVLERGKDVQARRRDLAAINKEHLVNPESNYCFGEGGAGTYSDGKLYTRSNKRGDLRRVLELFVQHGANERILVDAHPHIGTNKLPKIIAAIRETIRESGGEVWFDTKVTDFIIEQNIVKGVITADGKEIVGVATILATGHSARDIFELLHQKNITIENKPFAMGVRIEHPQSVIDGIQYHCSGDRGPYLPAASYSLVTQTHVQGVQRGVFSFCMCPGGFIVPAATAPGEVVVNGMSPSRRDSAYANSGMVVAVTEADVAPYKEYGPLAGLQLQKEIEQRAWALGGQTQVAPAQRVGDFLKKKVSSALNDTSYQPGLKSVDMYDVLPFWMAEALRGGLNDFGRQLRGYVNNDAQIVGVESRTSSPVRIPRKSDTCEHPGVQGLFPCGEGAGYAGGIMSAAMDGERCANAVAALY